MRQVLVLHGWSDDSDSFRDISQKLNAEGFDTLDIWLADYESMDDDVTIPDVAKRMEEVVSGLVSDGTLKPPFDMIVHSTGGLVSRQWLVFYDRLRKPRWLKRLVMLAPANYGSALAAKGKSFIGRVTKGIGNGFQTGTQVLNALELGSPYQWGLALSDVLTTAGSGGDPAPTYGDDGCLPFVLSGIKGYDGILMKIVNENGADGTVRAAAANLSAYGATLDFTKNELDPDFEEWSGRDSLAPYAYHALLDEDHSSIKSASGKDTLSLIIEALKCKDSVEYASIQKRWADETNALEDVDDPRRHRFFMLNTFVVDDLGNPVDDHFIEFFGGDHDTDSEAMVYFHDKVIRDVHQNSTQAGCRCFYLDRTELMNGFYIRIAQSEDKRLLLGISASPPGRNSRYFSSPTGDGRGDKSLHIVEDDPQARWLHRYSTHFLKIIIPRRPNERVFKLTQYKP